MKKLLVVGYWRHNLGDDLFLKLLMDRYPEHEVYLTCKRVDRQYYQHPRLKVIVNDAWYMRLINKLNRWLGLPSYFFLRYASSNSVFIILGGSLFIEKKNWEIRYRDWRYAVGKCGHKVLIGGNFGPYLTNEYYLAYYDLFSQLDDGCFRDQASLSLFKDLPQLRYAPDVVLTLPIQQKITQVPNYIISAIDLTKRLDLAPYQSAYENYLVGIIDELLLHDANVILYGFCNFEGDQLVMQRIVQAVKGQVTVKVYDTVEEAMAIFNQAQGIIATRFHAMILGWRLNIPTIPLIYSNKMLNVIKDYGFSGQFYDIKTLITQDPTVIWTTLQKQPPLDQQIITQAQQQFSILDQYLKG